MNFFIIATRDGVIPAADFIQKLVSRWPDAEVTWVPDPTRPHQVEFFISRLSHSWLDGSLNRRNSCIVFAADLPDYAEFALWCRSIIPPQEPLTFCDEGMRGNINLTPATTTEDIFRAFNERAR